MEFSFETPEKIHHTQSDNEFNSYITPKVRECESLSDEDTPSEIKVTDTAKMTSIKMHHR